MGRRAIEDPGASGANVPRFPDEDRLRLDGVERHVRTARGARRWVGVVLLALVIGFVPWTARAEDGWADGRQFGLSEAASKDDGAAAADPRLVAALTPCPFRLLRPPRQD
jgi:hypothetical protein